MNVTSTGALAITDSTFERTGTGLLINTDPAGIGVASVRVASTYLDNMQNYGADIYANGKAVTRVDFDQSWTSSAAAGSGVRMRTASGGTIKGVTFNQHQALLNGNNGIEIDDTGVSDVHANLSQMAQNVNSGMYVAGGVGSWSLTNSQVGAFAGLLGNHVGLTIGAGSGRFVVSGNDFTGNTTAAGAITPPTSATEIIENNVALPTPWTSYTPTLVSSTGTITTLGTLSGRYRAHGNECEIEAELKITTNGTGAGQLQTNLPCNPYGKMQLPARDDSTGALISALVYDNTTTLNMLSASGAYPGKDGADIVISGRFGTQ